MSSPEPILFTELSTLGNAFLGLRGEDGRFIGFFWAQRSSEMRR